MKGTTFVLSSPKQDDGASVGGGIFDAGPTLAANTNELAAETRGNVIGKYSKVERLPDEKYGQTTSFTSVELVKWSRMISTAPSSATFR